MDIAIFLREPVRRSGTGVGETWKALLAAGRAAVEVEVAEGGTGSVGRESSEARFRSDTCRPKRAMGVAGDDFPEDRCGGMEVGGSF